METFSARVSRLRRSHKLTQEDMAAKFGISRAYFWALESGKKAPSDTLVKMLSLLELSAQVHGNLDCFGMVKEEPGAYLTTRVERDNDPQVNRIIEYTQELIALGRQCDADTRGYILTQLRRHLSLNELAALAEGNAWEASPTAYKKERIPGSGLTLTENEAYQEPKLAREARLRPEGPERKHQQSDEEDNASGG